MVPTIFEVEFGSNKLWTSSLWSFSCHGTSHQCNLNLSESNFLGGVFKLNTLTSTYQSWSLTTFTSFTSPQAVNDEVSNQYLYSHITCHIWCECKWWPCEGWGVKPTFTRSKMSFRSQTEDKNWSNGLGPYRSDYELKVAHVLQLQHVKGPHVWTVKNVSKHKL